MGLFSSSKSSSTTQLTENNQYDQRQVYDAGGGLIGNGSFMDTSSFLDLSNRSTTSIDTSNRSTTNITNTSVDAGTVALAQRSQEAAASVMSGAMKDSFTFASGNNAAAFQNSRDAMGLVETAMDKAMSLARDVTTQAGSQAAQAAATANTAYQSAADTSTGNKTLIYVAMAAVALVAAGILFKR